MTSREPPGSRAELETELTALLRRSAENGVDVVGGYECRSRTDQPAFDVVVTTVEDEASE